MTERGVICPFRISARSVLHFIPGADGFLDCMTYQGPTRARVAWRVRALFSILQRGQGASLFSAIAPQKGQTDITGDAGFCMSAGRSASLGMVSNDLVMSQADISEHLNASTHKCGQYLANCVQITNKRAHYATRICAIETVGLDKLTKFTEVVYGITASCGRIFLAHYWHNLL
jgi:hypothetical protein